jgi:flagellar protein FliJ
VTVFRFRLQRVLDLRAESEQQAATELAHAQTRLQHAHSQKASLESTLEAGYSRLSAAGAATRTVGEMLSRCYVLDQLDVRLARADADVRAAEDDTRERQEAFALAFRDRRILDRLKEKQLEEWRTEEVRADLVTMDGIALTRFTSRKAAAAPDKESTT